MMPPGAREAPFISYDTLNKNRYPGKGSLK
jgi:hypothetical protein